MRIPTVIIVNDDNDLLEEVGRDLEKLVRVYYRTSVQGEQLYGVWEALLYFGDDGTRQHIFQDEYNGAVSAIQAKLDKMSERNPSAKKLLDDYLEGKRSLWSDIYKHDK